MKFLVCQKMIGEGCDYTIGCGMRFDFIEATSIEDAIEKIVWPDGMDGDCSLEGDMALSDILIIPSEHVVTCKVEKLASEVKNVKLNENKKRIEDEERIELQRLQAKYGT